MQILDCTPNENVKYGHGYSDLKIHSRKLNVPIYSPNIVARGNCI